MSPDAPILHQAVRWGENYVSRALNIKMAGVIPAGVYHGFVVKPAGDMAVCIEHEQDYPRSVAGVERDGYSLTVTMEDPGTVKIPAPGKWFICIEAYYAPTKQGYQRVVARQEVADHHVVLAAVSVDDGKTVITDSMIDYVPRAECFPASEILEGMNLKLADAQRTVISFSDLLTKETLKRIELETSWRTESEQSGDRLEKQENAANLQAVRDAISFIQLSDRITQESLKRIRLENLWLTESEQASERLEKQEQAANIQRVQDAVSTVQLSDSITQESLTRISQHNAVITELALGNEREAMGRKREAANAGTAVSALNRITNLELAFYSGVRALPALVNAMAMSPEGYDVYGGAKVTPVSIVGPGESAPLGAALVLKLEKA